MSEQSEGPEVAQTPAPSGVPAPKPKRQSKKAAAATPDTFENSPGAPRGHVSLISKGTVRIDN